MFCMKKISVLWCAALVLPVLASPLFNHKRSDWKIVVSAKASSTELFAAEELQNHLFRISGVKFPVDRSGKVPDKNAIVIGTARTLPALPEAVKNFPEGVSGNDSLRVTTLSGNLYLTGNVPRGSLYAVYTFLKNVMGVRWFSAGKNGDYVPVKSSFTLPELNIYDVAKFKYRGFHLCSKHYDEDMETWMVRNKINIMRSDPVSKGKWVKKWNDRRIAKGFHMMFSTHNVAIRDKKIFAERPELFASINGKRLMDQLCWSHPDVEKIMVERIIKYCRDYPAVEIINLSAADNMNYCRCGKCLKKTVHDLWFEFYNRLYAGVRKQFPDIKFATIAYQAYKKVPQCDMSSSAFVEYCMYDRCYTHRYGQCAMNDKALKNIKDWQKKNLPILVYGYEFDIFKPKVQSPFYYMISDQMKKFHAAGIAGAITECSPLNWVSPKLPKGSISGANHNRLGLYLYAAALWDHNVDPDAVIKEFSEAAYGPAAPFMAEYAMLMGRNWDQMKNHYSYFYNSPFGGAESLLNSKSIAEVEALFRKADAAVKTEKNPARKKIITANFKEEQQIFNVWKKFYQNSIASKSSMKIMVPRAKAPLDFSGCVTFDRFITKSGSKPVKPWQMKINYDDNAIYMDVVCKDDDMKNISASRHERDDKVYTDDCVEIFITVPNDTRGIYRHLIANANGAKGDTIALGGFTFDNAWNPKWQVKAKKNANSWHLQITIPFAELESAPPKPGDMWSFAVKRSNGGRKFPNSGFPDATYHDQNVFGFIQFSANTENVSLFLAAAKQNQQRAADLQSRLQNAGFDVAVGKNTDEIYKVGSDRKVYVFRHTPGVRFKEKFFQDKVLPALKNGALVIISGRGNVPVDKYFNDPKLKIQWSGKNAVPGRKTCNVQKSKWITTPENLERSFRRGIAPTGGFIPMTQGVWEEVAQIKLKDGKCAAILMTAPVGKGRLVVCSGEFGFSGGLALLGNANMAQTVKLIKNFYSGHFNK